MNVKRKMREEIYNRDGEEVASEEVECECWTGGK
jgi:hypothetical protein